MSSASEQQILRYAEDLGRLYVQAAEDRRLLERVTEVCLGLVRAASLEEGAKRICAAATDVLGLSTAAVYLLRKNRFLRMASHPDEASSFPVHAQVTAADLGVVEADEYGGPPWSALVPTERAVIAPLIGRRTRLGFLVGEGSVPAPGKGLASLLFALVTDLGGVVLENQTLEARRVETFRMRLQRAEPEASSAATDAVLGRSPAIQEVLALVPKLANVDSSVLLGGETGTGKSLIARAIHDTGRRKAHPFVTINCAAIPEALVESELFGHEVGAFTGAQRLHRGKVEQAEGGTLFLDEVGELPAQAQTKLLTFLEDRTFSRVGGEGERSADVRVIAASNLDLDAAVTEGTFRSDLLYRLNVFSLTVPPLRERGADVLTLATALGREIAGRYGLPAPTFRAAANERLLSYGWPGNVRELRNVIERAVILAEGGDVEAELLPAGSGGARPAAQASAQGPGADEESDDAASPSVSVDSSTPFAQAKTQMLEGWEIAYLTALLRMSGGNIARSCRIAQMDKKNLKRKLQRYGIDAQEFRDDAEPG